MNAGSLTIFGVVLEQIVGRARGDQIACLRTSSLLQELSKNVNILVNKKGAMIPANIAPSILQYKLKLQLL